MPLCPALVRGSLVGPGEAGKYVNALTLEHARAKGLRVNVLSPLVAEFSGLYPQMSWLERNYRFLMCAFDVDLTVHDESTYAVCTHNAQEWIDIVQSNAPEQLTLNTHYGLCLR